MGKKDIALDRLKFLIHYDPDTGILTSRVRRGRILGGKEAGELKKRTGYRNVGLDNERYAAHRLAWLYMTGKWPEGDIDHINGIRDDNRFCNLRVVTNSANIQNRHHVRCDSKLGVQGVKPNGKKWMARIGVDGKSIYLGQFESIEEARAAYLAAKLKFHPEYVPGSTSSAACIQPPQRASRPP